MEVVLLGSPAEVGALAADTIEALVRARARHRARSRHRLEPAPDLPGADPPSRRRPRPVVRRGQLLHPRRVRRAARRPPGDLPRDDLRELTDGLDIARERVASPDASEPEHAGQALRRTRSSRRRHRPAGARDRRRRPPRLQRARLVAGLHHPDEDPDRTDPRGQRPLLRLGRRGAPPRADPGPRHHPPCASPAAGRDRRVQGRGGRRRRRGPALRELPGVGPPDFAEIEGLQAAAATGTKPATLLAGDGPSASTAAGADLLAAVHQHDAHAWPPGDRGAPSASRCCTSPTSTADAVLDAPASAGSVCSARAFTMEQRRSTATRLETQRPRGADHPTPPDRERRAPDHLRRTVPRGRHRRRRVSASAT